MTDKQLTPEQLESLRFKLKVRETEKPLPDTHKIDPRTDMTVGDIKHHFPPKGN